MRVMTPLMLLVLTLGGGGSSILIVPDGSRPYIGMNGQDKVAVVDLGKLEVVSELETGEGPDGMAWVGAVAQADMTAPRSAWVGCRAGFRPTTRIVALTPPIFHTWTC